MNDRTSADPSRVVASLARDRVSLDLKTVELCFLAGLYLRADRAALASFDEEVLVDLFEQACEVAEPSAENPRLRATHAIQRLREQRMLARVDGAGIVRAGEYALTRLATAVVEYFLTDEALTRESLRLLTGTLRAKLAEIVAAARQASSPEAWHSQVVGPLQVTVADLVLGIERRQRGLDDQQEEIRARISALLQADWSSAVDTCQGLLDSTAATLRELNEVLLSDTTHLSVQLQDIQNLATEAGSLEGQMTAQRVMEHVDRTVAWGGARQKAWSEYYQHVNRYLRDVVRLDPDRALSQRLRDQIAAWPQRPFHLVTARAPSIRLLRPMEARLDRPPVERPRSEREAEPALVEADSLMADIEALVAGALAAGACTLAEVSARVLAALPEADQYAAAGRVAGLVLGQVRTRGERERSWASVLESLEVEDWDLEELAGAGGAGGPLP